VVAMELSIICVNWNSVDYLLDCIASIRDQTHGIDFEIIVVDNASPEGKVEALQQCFPDVKIIKSAANLGFSGANNLGYKSSTGKYLLFLNPDTRLAGPAICVLMDQIRKMPDAGIVGCKLLNTDLSVQTQSIQRFPTILNQLLDIEYLRLRWPGCRLWELAPLFSNGGGPVRVEVIPGACMLLKREVFEAAGGFSEEYFMYAEDIDLNYKVSRLGLRSYYVGRATVIHHGGKSSGQQRINNWATVMKFRAMRMFYGKTRGRFYAEAYRVAMGCAALLRLAVLMLMLPFASLARKRDRIAVASAKWSAVLRWAAGADLGAWAQR
jgi:N-acetylglucosaminyl-diphospho-decaprenol L-rhamnosyltransferase